MALGSFFSKLKAGLSRSTEKLTGGLTAGFAKRVLDDDALAELEELLLGADLGPAAAADIVEDFRRSRFGRSVTDAEIKAIDRHAVEGGINLWAGPASS